MFIEMTITALAIDPFTNSPVVILKDKDEKNTLPIWIGPLEASAIAMEMEGIEFARPMTHDLMCDILGKLEVKVEKVMITDLADNTYYARIILFSGEKEFVIDARPSDSMAIALRTKSPIYVDEKVLEASKQIEVGEKLDLSDEEKLKDLLENLDPESFGKYKM